MNLEKAFLVAVDDLNAGRAKPVERYLELVSRSEQEELADLLAMVFANRPPTKADTPSLDSPSYKRALAALDEVIENAGQTGILPGTLVSLRRVRGLKSQHVTEALVERFKVGGQARRLLEWFYHRLEAGQLAGGQLSRRLLTALAEIFGVSPEDFVSASEPIQSGPPRFPSPVMARSTRRTSSAAPPAKSEAPTLEQPGPDAELVRRLFQGGRDA